MKTRFDFALSVTTARSVRVEARDFCPWSFQGRGNQVSTEKAFQWGGQQERICIAAKLVILPSILPILPSVATA